MHSNSCATNVTPLHRFVAVPDGNGGTRHELRLVTPQAPTRGKRKTKVPDPITGASAEAAAQQLRQFIERAERILEEIAGGQNDLADVFAEAKATGFDGKTMRAIIARRKKEKNVLQEEDALLEAYQIALGLA